MERCKARGARRAASRASEAAQAGFARRYRGWTWARGARRAASRASEAAQAGFARRYRGWTWARGARRAASRASEAAQAGFARRYRGVMARDGFVHLHLHTQYSLLDGAIKLAPLFEQVKALGQRAVGMTDHGNLFGVAEFHEKARAAGVKPLIGCET